MIQYNTHYVRTEEKAEKRYLEVHAELGLSKGKVRAFQAQKLVDTLQVEVWEIAVQNPLRRTKIYCIFCCLSYSKLLKVT